MNVVSLRNCTWQNVYTLSCRISRCEIHSPGYLSHAHWPFPGTHLPDLSLQLSPIASSYIPTHPPAALPSAALTLRVRLYLPLINQTTLLPPPSISPLLQIWPFSGPAVVTLLFVSTGSLRVPSYAYIWTWLPSRGYLLLVACSCWLIVLFIPLSWRWRQQYVPLDHWWISNVIPTYQKIVLS
jgi:hypothetical protein